MDKYRELRKMVNEETGDAALRASIASLLAERDAAMKTLNVLLSLHDAKVDTARAWNDTFDEARELLSGVAGDYMTDKQVNLTLGCARFLYGILNQEIENTGAEFYRSRLDELSAAIEAAKRQEGV